MLRAPGWTAALASARALLACSVVALAVAGGPRSAAAGTFLESESLVHDGLARWYDLYVPDGPGTEPMPLLLVLHGGTVSNDVLEGGTALLLRDRADAERFLIALPNATSSETGNSGPSGSFNWNDCRSDAGPARTTADDVGFLEALIDEIAARYPVDPERVYATGASNGGLMAYRLALELPHRVAAVAATIANLPANSECPDAPAEPLSVLIMNGTADPLMPWTGGQVAGSRGLVLSAEATRDFWRERLGTAATPEHTDFPDLDPGDGSTVSRDLYAGGGEGSVVSFHAVHGGGHTTPSIAYPSAARQNHDVEGLLEIWRFLADKRLSGTSGGARASGLQITPDGRRTLISKDVGGERWAITYEPESGDLTGNVFRLDGGPAQFVACTRIGVNPSAALLTFACSGSFSCGAAPCTSAAWTPLGEVMLPATFFFPPFAGD